MKSQTLQIFFKITRKCLVFILCFMWNALHKYIIRGEFFQFLTYKPRCNKYQLPCRQYRAKSSLHNTEGFETWKLIKRINSKLWTEKIHDYLYLVYDEDQIIIPGIYKHLFSINENLNRMQTAVNETRGVFKPHMNRAHCAIKKV